MADLVEKYKAWKKYCAKPYNRYALRYNLEMNSISGKPLNKDGPLTSTIYELISPEIRLQLNKIRCR